MKLANRAQQILKTIIVKPEGAPGLQHLRHLIGTRYLPKYLKKGPNAVARLRKQPSIFLLSPYTRSISQEGFFETFQPFVVATNSLPRFYEARFPVTAPKSHEQAQAWSEKYWPCTYNPASQVLQDAPPLNLLREVTTELEEAALSQMIELALTVGKDTSDIGLGRNCGAIVVDPATREVIAAAGDARWHKLAGDQQSFGSGRPEHHALMRVIAMVADKELIRRGMKVCSAGEYSTVRDLRGTPISPIEKHYVHDLVSDVDISASTTLPPRQTQARPDTYLCTGLDLYLTHEPCVCCTMAMLHSRFRACIFIQRMPGTGGFCAEEDKSKPAYGLFWRKELNWRTITFETASRNEDSDKLDDIAGSQGATWHA